jgi:multimeric flavodoxin WrbA
LAALRIRAGPFVVTAENDPLRDEGSKLLRTKKRRAAPVRHASTVLKKVGEVTGDELLACDALIVGSPVYYANMAGEIKTFFDNWLLKFRFAFTDFKMRNKIGGAFVTEEQFRTARKPQCNLSMQRC